MCRSELSAVIARLISKCLWSGWKCHPRFPAVLWLVNVRERKPRWKKKFCGWVKTTTRGGVPEVFSRKKCSERFSKFYRKTSVLNSQAFRSATLLKRHPTQVFSCEVCGIYERHLQTTASEWVGVWKGNNLRMTLFLRIISVCERKSW